MSTFFNGREQSELFIGGVEADTLVKGGEIVFQRESGIVEPEVNIAYFDFERERIVTTKPIRPQYSFHALHPGDWFDFMEVWHHEPVFLGSVQHNRLSMHNPIAWGEHYSESIQSDSLELQTSRMWKSFHDESGFFTSQEIDSLPKMRLFIDTRNGVALTGDVWLEVPRV